MDKASGESFAKGQANHGRGMSCSASIWSKSFQYKRSDGRGFRSFNAALGDQKVRFLDLVRRHELLCQNL